MIQELRIGNWIMGELGNEMTVCSLYKNSIECDFDGGWCSVFCPKPIPLSKEILEKCGFVEMKTEMSGCRVWEMPNKLWRVAMSYRDELEFILWHRQVSPPTWRLASFQYLHELQNIIYALTKQELEYKP